MIAVIDYGAGNLRNVCKALEFVGAPILLTDKPADLARADKIVLPGVGAFADCANGLRARGLWDVTRDLARAGKPLLGICVGMQLLFEAGEEMGVWDGLGLIEGRILRFGAAGTPGAVPGGAFNLKVPHIGWNQIDLRQPQHPLLRDVQQCGYAYFVHSFHAAGVEPAHVIASCEYGYAFPAVVARDNVLGIQFHPEKSQDVGLQMLRNFAGKP